jgi:hypothetical protein
MKNHAASSEHSKMRVVCPCCYGEEKTYRRMSELQKHTEKHHQSLTDDVKTSSFFSEANGFWLSIHPEDYARLIKPTDHDTILAIRTRAAVSRWLERTGTSSRSRQQWEDGWKTQDKSKKHIHEQPTSGNPPYSPSRPSMEEQKVQLASLNFCSSGNIAYLTSKIGNGEIWFKADLSEKDFDDKRTAESLIRRMKFNHSTTTTPKHFTTEVKDISELTKSISKELGITDIHIKKITRQTLTFETTKKRKMQELAEELEISDEIELMETYIQETDQITENGTSENTTTGSRSNTQQPDEASSSSVIQNILTNTENDKDTDTNSVDTRQEKSADSTYPTIQDNNTTTGSTTKERAERLLRTGVIPMIPPARRE